MSEAEEKKREQAELQAAVERSAAEVLGRGLGIGVDVQLISEINYENPNFLERNFTEKEIEYCRKSPDVAASFAGRWAAKEAVAKAVMNFSLDRPSPSKGGGGPLIEIEILPANSGSPRVLLHGYAAEVAREYGIREIKISLSHSGDYVAVVAMILHT